MPSITQLNTPGGPLIQVFVGVTSARAAELNKANLPIPNTFRASLLIDTGASCTALDHRVLAPLGLTPTGSTPVNTPTTGSNPHSLDLYDVAIIVLSGSGKLIGRFDPLPVIASSFFGAQGIDGLLGRDILGSCVLHYNGEESAWTLGF